MRVRSWQVSILSLLSIFVLYGLFALTRPLYSDETSYIYKILPCYHSYTFCNYKAYPLPDLKYDAIRYILSALPLFYIKHTSIFLHSVIASIAILIVLYLTSLDSSDRKSTFAIAALISCVGLTPWTMQMFRPESLLIIEVALLACLTKSKITERMKDVSCLIIVLLFTFGNYLSIQILAFNVFAFLFFLSGILRLNLEPISVKLVSKVKLILYSNLIRSSAALLSIYILFKILVVVPIFLPSSGYRTGILEHSWSYYHLNIFESAICLVSGILYVSVVTASFYLFIQLLCNNQRYAFFKDRFRFLLVIWYASSLAILLVDPFSTFYRVNQLYLASLVLFIAYSVHYSEQLFAKAFGALHKIVFWAAWPTVIITSACVLSTFKEFRLSTSAKAVYMNRSLVRGFIHKPSELPRSRKALTCKKSPQAAHLHATPGLYSFVFSDQPIIVLDIFSLPNTISLDTANLWYVADRLRLIHGVQPDNSTIRYYYKFDCSASYSIYTDSARQAFLKIILREHSSDISF